MDRAENAQLSVIRPSSSSCYDGGPVHCSVTPLLYWSTNGVVVEATGNSLLPH